MSPLKRVPELRKLSEDHHHGLVLARRAKRAAEENEDSVAQAWKEVKNRFRNELEPHFQIEEKYLVPPLEAHGKTELVERTTDDHRRLRKAVSEDALRSASGLKAFGEMLDQHIRFEERELFEEAQRLLSRDDLKAIERACETPPRS